MDHKESFIAKFYGFHGVQIPHGDIIYMVVMANVFDTKNKIHETYDIKVEIFTTETFINLWLLGIVGGKKSK